jgi:hypothetical protein
MSQEPLSTWNAEHSLANVLLYNVHGVRQSRNAVYFLNGDYQ